MIIWLASYPKSGNTWLRMFLRSYFLEKDQKFSINSTGNKDFETSLFPNYALLKELNIDYKKFKNIYQNWINLQSHINKNNKVNFLKTHNANLVIENYKFTDTDNTIGGIYIVRDPRDVLISYSHHLDLSHEEVLRNMTDNNNYELCTNDPHLKEGFIRTITGSWSTNYQSWKSYKGRHLHFLKYEDLTKNPKKEFFNILKYLKNFVDFEIDEEKVNKSIKETTFINLQNIEKKEGFKEEGMRTGFFRKGKVGDWRTNLDPKIAGNLESKFEKLMKELGYLS